MTVNPLPPQAYTRETLQKAYTWLLNQNASIKEMASTQDMLISLYLKAQRNGDASLDTPSIQNFKQELKSLANMMGDFQTPPQSTAPPASQSVTAPHPQANIQINNYSAQAPQSNQQNTVSSSPTLQNLDHLTLQAITDVKNTLNLSSDQEAIRALVALGYKHFKKIHT